MRVVIANITSGGMSGGYLKYLLRMMPELRRQPSISALTVLVPKGLAERLGTTLPITVVEDGRWRSAIDRHRPDVVFVPTARWVRVSSAPVVVMVRNMEPLTVPFDGNSPMECVRNLARAWTARRACLHASRIIAVSRHVSDFLQGRWHIGTERVGIVTHGVDAPLPKEHWVRPGGAPESFLFTAGSIRPARGLETALTALERLARTNPGVTLAIAGAPTPDARGYAQRLRARVDRLSLTAKVTWLGSLGAREMAWCYGNASAFLMTSRAEACPNIALEALSHGCPVVSTRLQPMPEFFGEAADYFDADDGEDCAETLARLQTDTTRSEALAARARARAAEFTWQRAAESTAAQLAIGCGRSAEGDR